MKSCSTIMAILLENRNETAVAVQAVLTKYGCNIRGTAGTEGGSTRHLHKCGNNPAAALR